MKYTYYIITAIFLFSCNTEKKIINHKGFDIIWTSKEVNAIGTTSILNDGYIYGHTRYDSIFKLDFKSGKLIWKRYSSGINGRLKPVIFNKTLFVGGRNKLQAFDLNGNQLWNKNTKSKTFGLTIHDSLLLNARTGQGLFANDIRNGKEIWKIKPNYQMLSPTSPSVIDSLLIIGNFNYKIEVGNHLTCLNIKNQKIIWEIKNKHYSNSQSVISGDFVFFNSDYSYEQGYTHKVELKTGKSIWKIKTNPEIYLKPLISKDKIYINSYKDGVLCLDTKNGRQIWSLDKKEINPATDFLLHDNVLYFCSQRGSFIAVDKEGKIIFKSKNFGTSSLFIYNQNVYTFDGNELLMLTRP